MKPSLDSVLWYMEDARDGIQALAIEAKLPIRDVVLPPVVPSPRWIVDACETIGLEVETARVHLAELESALSTVAPGIVRTITDARALFVIASNRKRITLLTTSLERVEFGTRELTDALALRYRQSAAPPPFLVGMPGADDAYAKTIARRHGEQAPIVSVASLRVATSRTLAQELAPTSFVPRLVAALVLLVVQSAVAIGATLLLGQAAANGRLDYGRIVGWGLALATQAVLQGALGMMVGKLNIELATILKRRLVDGSLSLEPDFVRREGIGANLSVAAESATVDQLSISDLTGALSAMFMFLTAFAYLATSDLVSTLILTAVVLGAGFLVVRYYRLSESLTALRIKLTDIFIERVLGHHTRLVQLPRARWHEGEDESLHSYVEVASRLDVSQTLVTLLPRIWLVLLAVVQLRAALDQNVRSLAFLPLVAGYAAMLALTQLLQSLQRLIRWPISLRILLPILAGSTRSSAPLATKLPESELADGELVIEASGLRFAYHHLRPPVLNGLNLRIHAGDQLLVTGPSGGGKSTLAAVLTGLRQPTAGLVMLRGLDQHSVSSSEWRHQVVSAPQFHENYVFQNTLAFNLLMGRGWPPSPRDLHEAEELCYELGLGDLLERMPAGIQQVVGETGWRLSHGERSRVFVARALLQNAQVLLFDESFGALDPETLEIAMETVRRRARTLLVISHK